MQARDVSVNLQPSDSSLEPDALPARFTLNAADGRSVEAEVSLSRDRVVIRRGAGVSFTVPMASYRGVSLRLFGATGGTGYVAVVSLMHREDALSFTLATGTDADEVGGAWIEWGRALGLPLLTLDSDGEFSEFLGAPEPESPALRSSARPSASIIPLRTAHAR